MIYKIIFITLSLLVLASQGSAQTIGFQSYMLDGDEPLADGQYSITFRMYDQAQGGELVWSETQALNISKGLVSAELGAVEPIGILPFNVQYWVSVHLAGHDEMGRLKLSYAPYAFSANRLSTESAYVTIGSDDTGLTPDWGRLASVDIGQLVDAVLVECFAQYYYSEPEEEDYGVPELQFRYFAGNAESESGDFRISFFLPAVPSNGISPQCPENLFRRGLNCGGVWEKEPV